MRIVYWNIRAGGGKRVPWIAAQLERWRPHVVGLCEFRATPPSQALAEALADQGLSYQRRSVSQTDPAKNGVLLASLDPLRQLRLQHAPVEPCRWLMARIEGGPAVGIMHAPNFVTGRKRPFFDSVTRLVCRWRGGPALFGGDTNTGVPPLDGNPAAFHDWEVQWLHDLDELGWQDAYRYRRPRHAAHTWYSPNAGNGYRLDQAFVNKALLPRLKAARYEWGKHPNAPPEGMHSATMLPSSLISRCDLSYKQLCRKSSVRCAEPVPSSIKAPAKSVVPASAMRAMWARSLVSSPTKARSAGSATPSRSSMPR